MRIGVRKVLPLRQSIAVLKSYERCLIVPRGLTRKQCADSRAVGDCIFTVRELLTHTTSVDPELRTAIERATTRDGT